MQFCDIEKESQEKAEKKTQDPPSQTEGGAPSVWMRGIFAEQFMIADRLREKKESKSRPGHPSSLHLKLALNPAPCKSKGPAP
jgi:hypothetical protein